MASHTQTPTGPPKHVPNAHPYAIKTTSTALLTRSNSSPHAKQGRHHYVPLASPIGSRSRSGSRSGSECGSGSGSEISGSGDGSGGEGRNGYRGHRFSKSLGADYTSSPYTHRPHAQSRDRSPARSLDGLERDAGPARDAPHVPRRNTVSSALELPPSQSQSQSSSRPRPDLPESPKTWTPSQLSTYLATALRTRTRAVASGGQEPLVLPERVVQDISAWVRTQGITGRAFLRLEEDDLRG